MWVASSLVLAVVAGCHSTVEPKAWGPRSREGLELGCRFDASRNVIECSIRNRGGEPVRYSDYLLGEPGALSIAVSANGREWRDLESSALLALSAGAFDANIHVLEPGQLMGPRFGQASTEPAVALTIDAASLAWPADARQFLVRQCLGDDGSRGTWRGTLESNVVTLTR